jgi:SAM-dependent methyltransferase
MALDYVGSELEVFARATNWKRYIGRKLAPYIRGRVLEVGAGIGSNIPRLSSPGVTEWLALEPDAKLAEQIRGGVQRGQLPAHCQVMVGTLDAVPAQEQFDTILYIDVIEHIEDDRGEIIRAARLLSPGGRLIVLAPAHQFLYSPFDRSIGHFRRYNLARLRKLTPAGCRVAHAFMLDSAGFFASLVNRLVLRTAMPSPRQIAAWDRAVVPVSRLVDPVMRYRFGKTAIIVWQATA